MEEETYRFEDLLSVLPEGWQEMAKELGALQRARNIKTPKDLLTLIFFYANCLEILRECRCLVTTGQ
jgi:hypothetical protein